MEQGLFGAAWTDVVYDVVVCYDPTADVVIVASSNQAQALSPHDPPTSHEATSGILGELTADAGG
jgi:putative NIF3 family GTP cyclohydrolase 1 type 2